MIVQILDAIRLLELRVPLLICLSLTTLVVYSQDNNPPAAFGATPSERQLQWHQLQYYAFIHFGPNTFTDIEWGHGDESPDVFNPTALDCRQWASVVSGAGMEGIIITAKHHDGFCLWPSAYSTHTVKESAWREGKGDVLKELSEACKEYDLKFGVYVSPWDRNHPTYGTPEYNEVFKKMLEEVLTGYGEIFEVWFDGANGEGPNGKKQVYDFPGFAEVVRKHQPNAVIFSDGGPDIRWIGNENGYADEINWCTVRKGAFYPGIIGVNDQLQHGHENGGTWLPAEVNTSIRPGWFYHRDEDDEVKSLNRLIDNWYHSVGMNGNFLLNLPVDTRGLVHENDVERLMELKDYLDRAFGDHLTKGASASASGVRTPGDAYSADLILDNSPETFWAAADHVRSVWLEIDLGEKKEINALLLQEYIRLGQRVKSFSVKAEMDGNWKEIVSSQTIGNRRLVKFKPIEVRKLRITFDAKAAPLISTLKLYRVPEMMAEPQLVRFQNGMVKIWSESPDPDYYYTIDGGVPDKSSRAYTGPFRFDQRGTVKVRAYTDDGAQLSDVATFELDLPKTMWTIEGRQDSDLGKIIDGDPNTVWFSGRSDESGIVIDLNQQVKLEGFAYLPRQDLRKGGNISRYDLAVSEDGKHWINIMEDAEFPNIRNNPVLQRVLFAEPVEARFIRFSPIADVGGEGYFNVAELDIMSI